MIKITSQDSQYQYADGVPITHWDEKRCAWIVNKPYEKETIDWYGKDSDFPAGMTKAQYNVLHPNWKKNPDIIVIWTWNSETSMKKTFGHPVNLDETEWWKRQSYPNSVSRKWGYLDYSEEEAIKHLGTYCKWHQFADNVKIIYNNEVIFDGVLT